MKADEVEIHIRKNMYSYCGLMQPQEFCSHGCGRRQLPFDPPPWSLGEASKFHAYAVLARPLPAKYRRPRAPRPEGIGT